MNRLFAIMLLTFFTCMAPYRIFAESDTLLCSVINAAEYSLDEECFEGTAENFDLPQFIKIDFQGNLISEVGINTRQRKSKIVHLQRIDNKRIMQGVENGRSWNVIVNEETGKMSAAALDESVGFVVFGACIQD